MCIFSLFQLPKEQVDYARPDLPMYDYPPRVKFTVSPSESAKSCTFWLRVTGMNDIVNFQFPLKSKQCWWNSAEKL